MVNEFQKATGINVAMTRKSSGETYAQVKAEAANPKGDIWWGGTGDPHLQAAEEGLTEAYESPMLAQASSLGASKQHKTAQRRTVGIYLGALGFGYNTELLEQKKLTAPACWADLIKPEYKGEVQVANPNSSGTAYTFVATLVQLVGRGGSVQVSQGPQRERQPVYEVGRGSGAGRGARRNADRHRLPA